jgi:N-acetyl-anhydromuramyl-L-alanine amidase AmpD
MIVANKPLKSGRKRLDPDLIIVHAMAEYMELGEADRSAWEQLKTSGLSAHALITPSGVVVRCRADDQGAYHARGHNRRALGVEFLVPGVHTLATFYDAISRHYLTEVQYQAGVALVSGWCRTFEITDVLRHSDVDSERKRDPGDGFPWQRFLTNVFKRTA